MGNKNKSRKVANDGFSTAAASKKQSGSKKTTITVVCMVLVMAIFVGIIAYSKVVENGYFYRNTISVSSENYEVNNSMLSYYFNAQYQQMASSLQQMGVDTTMNLKDVQYTGGKSWYDYLMEQTVTQVKNVLVLCEAAKAEKFEMSEHDKEHIEEAITGIEEMAKTSAKQYGISEAAVIRNIYGYGVNIDDIRDAIELSQYASSYSNKLTESYDYSPEEWAEYLEEHREDYLVIDYVSYTFDAASYKKEEAEGSTTAPTGPSVPESTTPGTAVSETVAAETDAPVTDVAVSASDAEGTATSATNAADKEEEKLSEEAEAAKAVAYNVFQLMDSHPDTAKDIFDSKVKEHLETVVYASAEDAAKAESVETDMENTVTEAAKKNDSDEFLKFAFGKDRTKNVYIKEDDKNGKYTVYLITAEAPYIEEYVTKNIRVLSLSAADGDVKEACEAVMKEFDKTDKSEKAFEELVKAHSVDSAAHENGGLLENQAKNALGVDELDEWLYSDECKAGSYKYASDGQTGTSEMIHIVYCVGDGLKKWESDVDNAMISEEYEAAVEKFTETHKVEADMAEAYKIPSQAGIQ